MIWWQAVAELLTLALVVVLACGLIYLGWSWWRDHD